MLPHMNTISDHIKQKLKERSWTPYRLAKESEVPQPTLKRILDGESEEPDIKTVKKLAKALECFYAELYDGPEVIRAWSYSPQERTSHAAWSAYERADEASRAVVDAFLGVGEMPRWLDSTAIGLFDMMRQAAQKQIDERKNKEEKAVKDTQIAAAA